MRNYLTILLIALSQITWSQDLMTMDVSSNLIDIKGQVQLDFLINDPDLEEFSIGDFKDFNLIQGPYQSNFHNNINGVQSSGIRITYLLAPKRTGLLEIPDAFVKAGGKRDSTKSENVMVVRMPNLNAGNLDAELQKGFKFDYEINKTDVYEGEEVIVDYYLYASMPFKELQVLQKPDLSAFHAVEFNGQRPPVESVTIGGRVYAKIPIASYAFYPTGKNVVVGELAVNIVTQFSERRNNRMPGLEIDPMLKDLFNDDFFNDDFFFGSGAKVIGRRTPEIRIKTRPLPTMPADFSDAIGIFDVQVEQKLDTMDQYRSGFWIIKISGTGDLSRINPPELKQTVDIETYAPFTSHKSYLNDNGIWTNELEIKYQVVPLKRGWTELPDIKFNYFNPEVGSPSSFLVFGDSIFVHPGTQQLTQKDLVDPTLVAGIRTGDKKDRSLLNLGFMSVGIIMFLFLGWRGRKYKARKKEKEEHFAIKQVFNAAIRSIQNGGQPQAILNAIENYLDERLNLFGSLSQWQNAESTLIKLEVELDTINNLNDQIGQLQAAIYSPLAADIDKRSIIDTLTLIEKRIR